MSKRGQFHKYIVKYFGHPLWLLWTGDLAMLAEISRYDRIYRLPREQLLERQWQKLKTVLSVAYESCPYYKELFDSNGMRPEDVRTPGDFEKIPVLTKAIIRERKKDLLSKRADPRKLSESATAGSTDVPVKFLRTKAAKREKWAQTASLNKWYGWDTGDRVAYLWGAAVDFYKPLSALGRIRKYLTNQDLMLPSNPLSPEMMESHRRRLLEFSPRIIQTYASPLYLLARHIEAALSPGDRLFPDLKAIVATAEPLYDYQREKLKEIFSCDVFDRYGTREMGLVATECQREHSWHINTEGVYLEIIRDGRKAPENELGEVIVTDLLNTAMPFIRYQMGDVGSTSDRLCGCGSGLPVMSPAAGRVGDLMVLPDGKVLFGFWLPGCIAKESPGLKQIQVIQEDPTRFTVKYVPGDTFSQNDLDSVRRIFIKTACSEELTLNFEKVNDIPRDPSGKSRACISKVKTNLLGT